MGRVGRERERMSAREPGKNDAPGPIPFVGSEIGSLEAVVVHTPGREIESMTPRTAQEVLYNDIIPLGVVKDEHRKLKAFLETVSNVYEITDLLARSLADSDVARGLIDQATAGTPAEARREELSSLSPVELAATLVHGLPSTGASLESVLSGRQYDLPPIPNLYFMRDSSMVLGEQVAIGAMAHGVRVREAQMLRAVFSSRAPLAFDGARGFDGEASRSGAGTANPGGAT
ncbi:MAG: arginine deiminase family protein, partial [Spirochaetales bacterium]